MFMFFPTLIGHLELALVLVILLRFFSLLLSWSARWVQNVSVLLGSSAPAAELQAFRQRLF